MIIGECFDRLSGFFWRLYNRFGYPAFFFIAWRLEFIAFLLIDYVEFVSLL